MEDKKRMQEQLKEITERLEQGIYEVFESDRYQEYLGVMSRFHKYSFNNTMLIAMQKPDATLVAGYDAWKQKFGRYVNKGEHGISIIAPNPIKIREEMEKIDPVTGEPILDERGQPVLEEVETTKMTFKVTTVFDVSQTDGKELPGLVADDLTGSVQNYALFMKTFETVSPVPIGFEEIRGDTHGYYHLEDKRIAIQSGMSELQTMKTAIHEMAHAVLHDMDLSKEADHPFVQRKDSSVREVEAESVAYTICTHYGLDTSDYSFGYIAAWSTDKALPELRKSLETIRSTSAVLITAVDDNMRELLKEDLLKRKAVLDSDVVIKFSGSMGSEVGYEKIVNMDKEQVRQLFDEMIQRIDNGWEGELHDSLEERGVQFDAIVEVEESNAEFYDFEYDYDLNELTDMETLALAEQAEFRINRTLYATVSDTGEIRRVNEEKRGDIQLSSEEAALLYGHDDSFGIYQLKRGDELLDYRFEAIENLQRRGLEIEKGNYNLVYQGTLEKSQTLDDIFEQFNLNHPKDFKGHSLSVSDIVVFKREGETKAHYVDRFGFAEVPGFYIQEKEAELSERAYAFEDKYLSIQKSEEGYDYSIYNNQYKEIDGGILENQDISIKQAAEEILEDAYGKAAMEQIDFDTLSEKAEEANAIQPEKQIVADFRERTRQHFQEWGGLSVSEIEAMAMAHALVLADDCDVKVEIKDAVAYGSRSRGLEKSDSDIDIVISYQSEELREDVFFNMLHEEQLKIGGVTIDMNPIRLEETGELGAFLTNAETYLEEKSKDDRGADQSISFYVAECGEFHNLGEFHENLTLEEAIACYHAIPAERMNGGKAIGFELQTGQEGVLSEASMEVFYGNKIDVDIVDHMAWIRDSTLLWDAMIQLAEAFPGAELLNREAMERLAEDIDAFTQGHDLYEYRDVVEDSEVHIEEIKTMLVRQDTEPLRKWLQEVINEDFLPEEMQEAETLLGRLDDIYLRRERNPLTKVEELEESNYNQIDGMLSNLDGENKISKGSIHERLKRAKLSLERRQIEPLPKGNSKSKEESIN